MLFSKLSFSISSLFSVPSKEIESRNDDDSTARYLNGGGKRGRGGEWKWNENPHVERDINLILYLFMEFAKFT